LESDVAIRALVDPAANSTHVAYQSPDGATWTLIDSDTIAMGSTVYVDLATVSHAVMTTTTSTFDDVAGSW
jgi:hypothetical protein